MSEALRLGLIGCGNIARVHLGYLPEMERVRLVAASDPVVEARERVAEEHGVEVYEDGHALIQSGKVDAVLVATPHYFHPEYTIAALEHGLHVLVEKPVAVTAKQAERMNEAHRDCPEMVYAVMFQLRMHPVYRKVRQLIDEGRLGHLQRASWTITTWFRTQAYYDSGGWRATWSGEGGGVLLNQCPHNLDVFQWLVGMPSEVTAYADRGQHHDIEVEDEVSALMRFPNGATGSFLTSSSQAPGINRLELAGDRGVIIVEGGQRLQFWENESPALAFLRTSTQRFATPTWSRHEIEVGGSSPGHRGVTENFVAAVLDGAPLEAPGEEGLNGLELGNAMLMSGLKGGAISLPMDRDAYEHMLEELRRTNSVGA